ncbi:hypothetical protein BT69DRAFT_1365904 [Atractiella rhizophila]|nr:hypothetical protein BT69DRAFT_1365904 [Atractiella rhizophila]
MDYDTTQLAFATALRNQSQGSCMKKGRSGNSALGVELVEELSDYSQHSSTFGDITCEKTKMLTVQQKRKKRKLDCLPSLFTVSIKVSNWHHSWPLILLQPSRAEESREQKAGTPNTSAKPPQGTTNKSSTSVPTVNVKLQDIFLPSNPRLSSSLPVRLSSQPTIKHNDMDDVVTLSSGEGELVKEKTGKREDSEEGIEGMENDSMGFEPYSGFVEREQEFVKERDMCAEDAILFWDDMMEGLGASEDGEELEATGSDDSPFDYLPTSKGGVAIKNTLVPFPNHEEALDMLENASLKKPVFVRQDIRQIKITHDTCLLFSNAPAEGIACRVSAAVCQGVNYCELVDPDEVGVGAEGSEILARKLAQQEEEEQFDGGV